MMQAEHNGATTTNLVLPQPKEIFGKVIIKGKGKEATLRLLDGARFLNVDLKWYNEDGTVHSAYEKYKRNPFYFQFAFRNLDKSGREVEFTEKLLPSFQLNGMPAIETSELEVAEREAVEWVTTVVGLLSPNDEMKMNRFRSVRVGYFVTGVAPGASQEQRKLLSMLIWTFFSFDDMILDIGPNSYDELQLVTTLFGDVMRGDKTLRIAEASCPQRFRKYLLATQLMREEALKHVTEEEASDMFQAYAEHVCAYAMETYGAWKDLELLDPTLFRSGQEHLRYLSGGFRIVLEMVLVGCGIVVDKRVRGSFLCKHFLNLYERHPAIVNDVMSFRKEFKDEETCNYTYLQHVADGLPLEVALANTFDQINSLTNDIIKIGELLTKQFAQQPEVGRFVNVAKMIMQGHYLYFPFAARRYGHDFAYDCVVEEN